MRKQFLAIAERLTDKSEVARMVVEADSADEATAVGWWDMAETGLIRLHDIEIDVRVEAYHPS